MILFFSDDTAFGSNITERLRNQGIPAVSHDPDFAKSICEQLDFCGVILDGRQDPKRFEVLSESLFESYRELPIAFLSLCISAHTCIGGSNTLFRAIGFLPPMHGQQRLFHLCPTV